MAMRIKQRIGGSKDMAKKIKTTKRRSVTEYDDPFENSIPPEQGARLPVTYDEPAALRREFEKSLDEHSKEWMQSMLASVEGDEIVEGEDDLVFDDEKRNSPPKTTKTRATKKKARTPKRRSSTRKKTGR